MKIVDLKLYGTKVKTFVATIEDYVTSISDDILKNQVIIMVYKVITSLGYDTNSLDILKDIQIVNFNREDNEGYLLCVINVLNMDY